MIREGTRSSTWVTHLKCCVFLVGSQSIRIQHKPIQARICEQELIVRKQRLTVIPENQEITRKFFVHVKYNVVHFNRMLPSRTCTTNGRHHPPATLVVGVEAPIDDVFRNSVGPRPNAFFPDLARSFELGGLRDSVLSHFGRLPTGPGIQ